MTSMLEQLTKIVVDGKREAERIMERLDSNDRVGQTRELVISSRDTSGVLLHKGTKCDIENFQ